MSKYTCSEGASVYTYVTAIIKSGGPFLFAIRKENTKPLNHDTT